MVRCHWRRAQAKENMINRNSDAIAAHRTRRLRNGEVLVICDGEIDA